MKIFNEEQMSLLYRIEFNTGGVRRARRDEPLSNADSRAINAAEWCIDTYNEGVNIPLNYDNLSRRGGYERTVFVADMKEIDQERVRRDIDKALRENFPERSDDEIYQLTEDGMDERLYNLSETIDIRPYLKQETDEPSDAEDAIYEVATNMVPDYYSEIKAVFYFADVPKSQDDWIRDFINAGYDDIDGIIQHGVFGLSLELVRMGYENRDDGEI
jgi:hypothetical protein